MRHTFICLAALLLTLAAVRAADQTQPTVPVPKRDPAAPESPSKPATPAFKEQKEKKAEKRHEFLALKDANSEFLRSPQGIAFKNQIAGLEQELNAVYEKYLNVFYEGQGKSRTERDQQIHLLKQKIAKAESDYETLRDSSPAYHDMLQSHENKKKHEKSPSPEKNDDAK